MTFTIADLRKSRGDFSAITSALEKTNSSGFSNDDADYFKITRDKTGNASAVIRFLPKHPDDELPWVTLYSRGFQGPTGRWYIENDLSTLGKDDPVGNYTRELWMEGSEPSKVKARKMGRRTHYICNVYVVSNPSDPSQEGKVLRYKFGKKIFGKILSSMKPEFADDTPVNVFDPIEGANFKLRVRTVEGYPNYDMSLFSDPGQLADSEEGMLKILNEMKPLAELVSPDKFKTFDELQKKFDSIMNAKAAPSTTAEQVAEKMREEPVAKPRVEEKVKEPTTLSEPLGSDEDDIEAYFKKVKDSADDISY